MKKFLKKERFKYSLSLIIFQKYRVTSLNEQINYLKLLLLKYSRQILYRHFLLIQF